MVEVLQGGPATNGATPSTIYIIYINYNISLMECLKYEFLKCPWEDILCQPLMESVQRTLLKVKIDGSLP